MVRDSLWPFANPPSTTVKSLMQPPESLVPSPASPAGLPGSLSRQPAGQDPLLAAGWRLRRRVLPQHTDHAGGMWHGAYVGWLEEARVEALAAVGLAYSDLAAQGLELPVVALAIDYRQALLHGDWVEIRSEVQPRRGLRLPWRSLLLDGAGAVAAEARVELVAVQLGPMAGANRQRRLMRRLPPELETAVASLVAGPPR